MNKAQEKKIKKIIQLYYSRPDVQKAMFEFSKNREISPRYFEGFGKRPDMLQFRGDILSLAKNGATSFHCSEELWEDPLKIETGMERKEANSLRIGWDLLIDIDCEKGIEYSKLAAKAIIGTLKLHGIKNVGLKFSGSKGFHIIVPWKAFPKDINGIKSSELFPELPRKLVAYIKHYSKSVLKSLLPEDFDEKMKNELKSGYFCIKCGNFVEEYRKVEFSCSKCDIVEIKNFKIGTKGKLPKCYKCKSEMKFKPLERYKKCERCDLNSIKNPENFNQKEKDLYTLMGLDLILVSPRHLFRMPYSLHEKTSLSSIVIDPEKIDSFDMWKDANPLRIDVKNFMPEVEENEAAEFVMQALDWIRSSGIEKEFQKIVSGKYANFKPIKLYKITENQFPPSIKKILEGIGDGKKRALFILINLFRSIGMEKEDLEKRIHEWNKKNEVPLKKGYVNSQLSWSYRKKPIMPPNFRGDFYKGIGIVPCTEELRLKNPVNYVVRKNFLENRKKRNDFPN